MKRLGFFLVYCTFMPTPLRAGDQERQQTIAYVQKLQTSSGGFVAARPKATLGEGAPTLRATSAAVRTLHYLGGHLPNQEGCAKFVELCFDSKSGGFADTPRGKPDLLSTAVGLMAVVELKMPTSGYASGAVKYLSDHAKSFEDIRIAVAGLESIKEQSPLKDQWIKDVRKLQNPDGTFGKGLGKARATGGSVVAQLRMGINPADTQHVLQVLKQGQRKDGGFGKEESDSSSDLETTYRVMRCFMMLKSQPADVAALRSFLEKCRNEDGGYGVTPGQPSSIGGTYYASIITYWLKKQP